MEKTVEVISAVLYELIPLRSQDAIDMYVWLYENLGQLVVAFASVLKNVAESILKLSWKNQAKVLIWVAFFIIIQNHYVDFNRIYVVLTILSLMVGIGFDKRGKDDFSAYSVFNGFNRLIGAAEENLEREMEEMNLRRRG